MTHHQHTHPINAETEGITFKGISARRYDWISKILSMGQEKKLRNKIVDRINIQPGQNVLDIGCGTGTLTILTKQRQGPEGKIIGVDPSAEMLEIGKKKAVQENVDVEFKVGVIENLEFPDNTFDMVINSFMIHHLPDPLKTQGLQEIQRVLKPGGKLLIVDLEPQEFSLFSLLHGYFHAHQRPQVLPIYDGLLDKAGFAERQSGPLGIRSIFYISGIKPKNQ